MAGNLADVITCAKFREEIFRGYVFPGGRISHFPIDFCMGLTTVQRDCAACDKYTKQYALPSICISCANLRRTFEPRTLVVNNSHHEVSTLAVCVYLLEALTSGLID